MIAGAGIFMAAESFAQDEFNNSRTGRLVGLVVVICIALLIWVTQWIL